MTSGASSRRTNGEEITIRPTAAADLPDLMDLWNDGRVMRWVGFPDGLGYTEGSVARWFERIQARPDCWHFVIESSVLGFCGEAFYEVDRDRRGAGLDIKLRPETQGGGRAWTAFGLLLKHVFASEPQVDAAWTEPSEENLAARTLYWSRGLRPSARPAGMEPGPSYWEITRQAAQELLGA
jgi:RimJ/RimL family protein N-acetyltransferase